MKFHSKQWIFVNNNELNSNNFKLVIDYNEIEFFTLI